MFEDLTSIQSINTSTKLVGETSFGLEGKFTVQTLKNLLVSGINVFPEFTETPVDMTTMLEDVHYYLLLEMSNVLGLRQIALPQITGLGKNYLMTVRVWEAGVTTGTVQFVPVIGDTLDSAITNPMASNSFVTILGTTAGTWYKIG